MRRTAVALALASLLALTACSEDGSSAAPAPSEEGNAQAPTCDETFRVNLQAEGFRGDTCWTTNPGQRAVVSGDRVLHFANGSTSGTDTVIALDATNGEVAWESDPIEGFREAPEIHGFRDADTNIVVVGYYASGGFTAVGYDGKSGEKLFSSSQPAYQPKVTWGDNAVAVTDSTGTVSVLTVDNPKFTPTASQVPWATKDSPVGSPGAGESVKRVLYVTEDRLVLDWGILADGSSGIPVVTTKGEDMGAIVTAKRQKPHASFIGDFALVQVNEQAQPEWRSLSDLTTVTSPVFSPGTKATEQSDDPEQQTQPLAHLSISPEGSTLLADGRLGIRNYKQNTIGPDIYADVISAKRGYSSSGPTIDLTTWLATEDATPRGFEVVGIAITDASSIVVYSGPFGLGGMVED